MFATSTDAHSAFAIEVEQWNGAVFGLSLVTNLTVTTLIASRVWYVCLVSVVVTTFHTRVRLQFTSLLTGAMT